MGSKPDDAEAEGLRRQTLDIIGIVGVIAGLFGVVVASVPVVVAICATAALTWVALFLLTDLLPWLRSIPLGKRLTILTASVFTYCTGVLVVSAHGDLFEPPPNFAAQFAVMTDATLLRRHFYVMKIGLENNGSQSYAENWDAYYIGPGGEKVEAFIVPAPAARKDSEL